jgi:hypothetical protein
MEVSVSASRQGLGRTNLRRLWSFKKEYAREQRATPNVPEPTTIVFWAVLLLGSIHTLDSARAHPAARRGSVSPQRATRS